MLTSKFTILELTDLALRVPEIGAVNFNLLHTVLVSLIQELGLDNLKPPCHIEDETLAEKFITMARLEASHRRKPSIVPTVQEMEQRVRTLEEQIATDRQREKADAPAETPEEPVRDEGSADRLEKKSKKMKSRKAEDHEEKDEGDRSEVAGENPADEDTDLIDPMTVEEMQEAALHRMQQRVSVEQAVEVVSDALQILTAEALLDSEPAKVMEEMWRATNINRRMEAAETGLSELSALVDEILNKKRKSESEDFPTKFEEIAQFPDRIKMLEETCKTLTRGAEDCIEQREAEVQILKATINEMLKEHEVTQTAVDQLESDQEGLRLAYQEDLEDLRLKMSNALEAKMKELKKLLREVEDTMVRKEDFMELMTRVEDLEEKKISREELERLLQPGFIDSFLDEQVNQRTELEKLKATVAELEENLEQLRVRIDEEIIPTMEASFAEIREVLGTMKEKLDQLDPDEINDSFANLEERADVTTKELEEAKLAIEQIQKEARISFNKISNLNDLLNRLEKTKADKSKMYELLKMKADIDLVVNKIDRNEFATVVAELENNHERLSIVVKINEEEMNHNFMDIRHELALKMYTEDFITATEPIRNRIKALLYEVERVKQISLTHLFPDAPGVLKCFSCKRGANLAGPKYLGDADLDLLQEVPPGPRGKTSIRMAVPRSGASASRNTSSVRLPPIDLDSVPVPPPDKPRQTNVHQLPVLLASARPQIGLTHQMSRKAIDKKLAAYFATRPVRSCDGEYTRTMPQQRGLDFTDVELLQAEREEVLLKGIDHKYYRGVVQEEEEAPTPEPAETEKKPRSRRSGKTDAVLPTGVSLHVDNEPFQTTVLLSPVTVSLPSDHVTEEA